MSATTIRSPSRFSYGTMLQLRSVQNVSFITPSIDPSLYRSAAWLPVGFDFRHVSRIPVGFYLSCPFYTPSIEHEFTSSQRTERRASLVSVRETTQKHTSSQRTATFRSPTEYCGPTLHYCLIARRVRPDNETHSLSFRFT